MRKHELANEVEYHYHMPLGVSDGARAIWPTVCISLAAFILGAAACAGVLWWQYSPALRVGQQHMVELVDQRLSMSNEAAHGYLLQRNAILLQRVKELSGGTEGVVKADEGLEDDGSMHVALAALGTAPDACESLVGSLSAEVEHWRTKHQELARLVNHLKAQLDGWRSPMFPSGADGADEAGIGGVEASVRAMRRDIQLMTGMLRPLPADATAPRWAYVTMAPDGADGDAEVLHVLALARALQRLSAYPLVLLSRSRSANGTALDRLRRLGVQILPAYDADTWPKIAPTTLGERRFRLLQAWNLTQFEKVVWVDPDSLVQRSLDWLFERSGVWAQRDNKECSEKADKPSSSLVLLEPNIKVFAGLVELAASGDTLLVNDMSVIGRFYTEFRSEPINLLNEIEACYGQCLGTATTPYINTDGSEVEGYWSMPALVYKSGGWRAEHGGDYSSVCFSHDLSRQKYFVGASILNACQYNPLGVHWRSLFCEGAAFVGIRGDQAVERFCSDACYYLGRGPHCGGPLNGTLTYSEYATRTKGMPLPEIAG